MQKQQKTANKPRSPVVRFLYIRNWLYRELPEQPELIIVQADRRRGDILLQDQIYFVWSNQLLGNYIIISAEEWQVVDMGGQSVIK